MALKPRLTSRTYKLRFNQDFEEVRLYWWSADNRLVAEGVDAVHRFLVAHKCKLIGISTVAPDTEAFYTGE